MPAEMNLGLETKAEEMSTLVESSRTTTKKEMVERIAAATNQSRTDVKRTIQAFLDEVIEELGRGNRLEWGSLRFRRLGAPRQRTRERFPVGHDSQLHFHQGKPSRRFPRGPLRSKRPEPG